jgi:hypothetical protein
VLLAFFVIIITTSFYYFFHEIFRILLQLFLLARTKSQLFKERFVRAAEDNWAFREMSSYFVQSTREQWEQSLINWNLPSYVIKLIRCSRSDEIMHSSSCAKLKSSAVYTAMPILSKIWNKFKKLIQIFINNFMIACKLHIANYLWKCVRSNRGRSFAVTPLTSGDQHYLQT